MSKKYTAIVFENTGFNSVNIPLNKLTVTATADDSHTCTDLTITQEKWLSSINLPLTWEDVKEADYMFIYPQETGTTANDSWCYFVVGATMQAEDVATLSLVPDFLTSVGISNLEILDGITVRSTYALNNIDPNKLASDDPYLTPAEPMELLTGWKLAGDTGAIFIDSTYDIVSTAYNTQGVTYTDANTNETVTVPEPVYANGNFEIVYKLVESDGTTQDPTSHVFNGIGTNGFIITADNTMSPAYIASVKAGIARLRSLGLESAILHQVFLPYDFVRCAVQVDQSAPAQQYKAYVTSVNGVWRTVSSGIAMVQDTDGSREAGVLNFSEFAKYGLMSASGDGIEVEPKDLMTLTTPNIVSIGDPRPEGKPYFRFEKINIESFDRKDFFRNSVSGLNWKNVPLVFTQASENALTTAKYNVNRKMANTQLEQAKRGYDLQNEIAMQTRDLQKTFNAQNQVLTVGTLGTAGYNAVEGPGSTSAGLLSAGVGVASGLLGVQQTAMQQNLQYAQGLSQRANEMINVGQDYANAKMSDLLSYGISINYQLPDIMFPYNTEMLRDFYGNGVFVYRFWYSQNDRARVKRIIRAYGAKYSMLTDATHFEIPTGSNYCYIEATGVSIGDLPKWQADGIALQLANGVRIWNTRPAHIQ